MIPRQLMQQIMLTRPAQQAGTLSAYIQAAGGTVFLFPTLEIHTVELAPQDQEKLENINQYDIIIFISPNAVEHGLKHLQASAPLSRHIQLATIGKGSSQALSTLLGRQPDICPNENFNSEGLLALDALQNVSDKRILIIRGNGGREHLKQTLQQRGASVDYLSAYQRIKPATDSTNLVQYLQNKQIAVIVITSAESLKNLVELTPAEVAVTLLGLPLLLINKRLIDVANKAGFNNTFFIAKDASDEAIFATLKENNLLNVLPQ